MLQYIIKYFESIYLLTSEMAPFLLLGFLFAGVLKVVVPPSLMTKYLGKSNSKSVINASLLGVPLPLCSCGVLPAGISLYKNGASKGSSVSFLISTPQTGVDSVLVTWSMLGLPFALLRPIIAFITGIVGGFITNKVENTKIEQKVVSPKYDKPKFSIKGILHYAFIEMVADIAKWLIVGLLIAAFITVLMPANFFAEYQLNGFVGMLIILAVSIPLYICATASVPIAAVLLLKGLSPGALLVFLMAGPATNAATITVIGKNLGKKTLFVYLSTLIIGSLFFGFLIDYFLPTAWFSPLGLITSGHNHELLPSWIVISSTVLLTILLVYAMINSLILKINNMKKANSQNSIANIETITLEVEGMMCVKCTTKVENTLNDMVNITSAIADADNNLIKVSGSNLSATEIGKKIQELGYDYNGTV